MKRSGFIQLAARMLYTALRHFCCAESESMHHRSTSWCGRTKALLGKISACNVNSRGRDTGNFSGTEKSFRSSIEKKKLSGEGFCGFPKVSGRGTGKLPESFFFELAHTLYCTAADHKPFLGRALSTFCVRCFAVFCNFSLFPSKVENS